jgi:hypothetical protein
MATRDVVSDLTALLLPAPKQPDPGASEDELDGWSAVADQIAEERDRLGEQLRLGWEEGDVDPLLGQLAATRREMLAAERRMRLLIAYGREFVDPRPYTLEGLAQAAGMSISGVRTAYDDDEIAEVAALTGARPRRRAGTAPTAASGTPAPPASGSVGATTTDRGEAT